MTTETGTGTMTNYLDTSNMPFTRLQTSYILIIILLGFLFLVYTSYKEKHAILRFYNILIYMYFIISFWYFMDYIINPEGSRACIQSDLYWIVLATFFLGTVFNIVLYMLKKNAEPFRFTALCTILLFISVLLLCINFIMIFPNYDTNLNVYTTCWMPFTLPIIILTFISVILIGFIYSYHINIIKNNENTSNNMDLALIVAIIVAGMAGIYNYYSQE